MIEAVLGRAGHLAARLYTGVALNTEIGGYRLLPQGAKILAANHPCTMDPFFLLALTREQVSVLITGSAFKIPIAGKLLLRCGHVPAVRLSAGATVEALRRKLLAGRTVAIFPEGALSPLPGGLHAAHTGVARLALSTGAPVIPVGIALDRSHLLPFTAEIDGHREPGRLYLRGRYVVTVGRPLRFRGSSEDRPLVRSVAEQIMQCIDRLARDGARQLEGITVRAGTHAVDYLREDSNLRTPRTSTS